MAPWVTPSGIFTRALGTPLLEWALPLPQGTAIRFPSADAVETIEREWVNTPGDEMAAITGRMFPALRELDEDAFAHVR